MSVRTLIVDDSEMFRAVLARRLQSVGCTIVGAAPSAVEGLQLFRSLEPDVVTLDLVMPGMEDYDSKHLFQDIRNESPDTSIIVISAQSKDANASWFLGHGALGYLEKSFMNFDDLRRRLKLAFPELDRPVNIWNRLTQR